MQTVVRMDFTMSEELRCMICGREDRHCYKQCAKARGLICEEHCQECEFWDDRASIGICRYGAKEWKEISALDHGQGLSLCSCRMWQDPASRRFIIAVGKNANYIVYGPGQPMEAVDRLLEEADAFATVASSTAAQGKDSGMLKINTVESRGIVLTPLWDGMYELRRRSISSGEWNREVYDDPREAWRSFREGLRIRLMMAIEKTQKVPQ